MHIINYIGMSFVLILSFRFSNFLKGVSKRQMELNKKAVMHAILYVYLYIACIAVTLQCDGDAAMIFIAFIVPFDSSNDKI